MPKLLIFAPCEKVIIDQASNTVSLITVLQEIHYKAPGNVQLPPNAPLAMRWSVLTLWQQEERVDAGVEFEQRFLLAEPARILLENTMTWTFSAPTHRMISHIFGFPTTASRSLSLHLSYRVAGAIDWIPVASFPIDVIREVM